ncbi:PREDICTED: 3-ketoacyl-CoA thiolase 2, peroxisomal-like [Populus euphratica]|uniref:3-ketoacyl-CoA thiolase 2, peroxisomal-like n=1 Tax=Populus euphratica TaxID=75702 RepID=A0AAJ6XFX4_POPEU|nr:PREDICTED: 3-ketoacyl-CoA thiolase 2, peroxisomal-like [Populus euphratica]
MGSALLGILAKSVMTLGTYAIVGVDPDVMGGSLVFVVPAAAKAAGLKLQLMYCRKRLEIVPQKINLNEDAMAIGHILWALYVFDASCTLRVLFFN